MHKNLMMRLAGMFVFIPITLIMPSPSQVAGGQIASTEKKIGIFSQFALNPAVIEKNLEDEAEIVKERAAKAEAIDGYFRERNMPLEGAGLKMVLAAEANGIDWRLLPAISIRESTGGKNACVKVKNNPFGWASCKIGFKTLDDAIETVARNLGGNNPRTEHHYEGKDTKGILRAYNPPSIIPKYVDQVISIMNKIGPLDVSITLIAEA